LRVGERCLRIALRRASEFIAGELFGDKPVERLVRVEGTDDIIAILVGVGARRIGVAVAVRIRVTRDVEPMAAPAFAVVGGGEEPFNER